MGIRSCHFLAPLRILSPGCRIVGFLMNLLFMLWCCNALGKRGDVSDGCVWRCPQCKTNKSIREGSFFLQSPGCLVKKWLLLLHCWVRQYPAKDAAEEAEVDPNTACDIYRYFSGGLS